MTTVPDVPVGPVMAPDVRMAIFLVRPSQELNSGQIPNRPEECNVQVVR